MPASNRVFWIAQGVFKYVAFGWAVTARRALYRPFFARVGRGLAVHDNVMIKYPDQISIGDHVTINPGCILAGAGGLSIGSDVMFGAGTKVVTSAHVTARTDVPMRLQGMVHTPITIGDDVWFGFDVKVMPGATIGRGSVIGAGSVVTGDIPAGSVAVGSPARVIGSRQP
jgi:acetyltransferase-like isoleucine patch superfamily enzyme